MKRFLCFLLACLLCFSLIACRNGRDGGDGGPSSDSGSGTPKESYYAVLFNSRYLTNEDASALAQISLLYPSHDVLPIDVKDCADATDVYALLQRKAAERENTLDGVQIIGTADAVPSFLADYKLALPTGTTTGTTYFTDYFYTGLENDPDAFDGFSVADHFAGDGTLSFTPHHPVIRLPLGSGELSRYVASYRAYVEEQNAVSPSLVSFSSSIFAYSETTSVDDLAYFLDRAENEWGIAKDVHVYTNQTGNYLSPVASLGDITGENLKKENAEGVKEFFLLGHGSRLSVSRTVFKEDGTQRQTPFLTYGDIAEAFDSNPYFLNIHACASAEGLDNNLIRRAMQSGCLGAFATTYLISNNGIDTKASVEEMTGSANFFGFHYAYLAACHEGKNRTEAFFEAQKQYSLTLAACAQEPIDYAANYQMGYHNLLTYTNFGIFEPEVAVFPTASDTWDFSETVPTERAFVYLSSGAAADDERLLSAQRVVDRGVPASVKGVTALPLDNGCIRFLVTVEASDEPSVRFVGNTRPYLSDVLAPYSLLSEESVLVIDLSRDEIKQEGCVALLFEKNGQNSLWLINTGPLF